MTSWDKCSGGCPKKRLFRILTWMLTWFLIVKILHGCTYDVIMHVRYWKSYNALRNKSLIIGRSGMVGKIRLLTYSRSVKIYIYLVFKLTSFIDSSFKVSFSLFKVIINSIIFIYYLKYIKKSFIRLFTIIILFIIFKIFL